MLTAEQQKRLARDMQAALAQARAGLVRLDAETQRELLALYETAAADIARRLRGIATPLGFIEPYDLPRALAQVDLVLQGLRDTQLTMIERALRAAADNGSGVITSLQASPVAEATTALPHAPTAVTEVLNAVLHGTAEDGLTVSDRIWRNYRGVRDELVPTLQRAVINGESAREATREALRKGMKVEDRLLNQIELARAGALGEQSAQILATDEAKAYANAARVFRTEMDRANILTSRAGIYAVEGVAGTRFQLSPSHPRYDICDMHAEVNLYGLGKGVYPQGQSPLPAHPNTLSFETVVFEWEVTDTDRAGRHDLMSWLSERTDDQLYGVLQSEHKVTALRRGLLQPEEIALPWRALKAKYEAQP